jgi:organic radical activating enzyme
MRDSHIGVGASPTDVHMSLEMFTSILDKHTANLPPGQPGHVKLLGGEPTLHPQFDEMLALCYERNINVTLISNFLFSKEKRDIILKYLEVHPMHFLINSTELDQKNRMETFKENYNEIYKFLYARNAEESLSCGITLDHTIDIEYYINYIDFLKSNLIAIENMRISLSFPGDTDKKNQFFFINNTKLGDSLVFITKKLLDANIPAHLDCINFPCMYESKEEAKFVKKFLAGSEKYICSIGPGPTDYMPDGTAIYCYPNANTVVDATKFKSDAAVQESLRMKYQIVRATLTLPAECVECEAFKSGQCEGPCLGFFSYDKV